MRATVPFVALALLGASCGSLAADRPSSVEVTTTLWNGFATSTTTEVAPTPSTTTMPPVEPTTTPVPVATTVPATTETTTTEAVPTTTVAQLSQADAEATLAAAVAAYETLMTAWFDNDLSATDVEGFLDLYDDAAFIEAPSTLGGVAAACYQESYPPPVVGAGKPLALNATVVEATAEGDAWRLAFDLELDIDGIVTSERNEVVVGLGGLAPDVGWGVITDCPSVLR